MAAGLGAEVLQLAASVGEELRRVEESLARGAPGSGVSGFTAWKKDTPLVEVPFLLTASYDLAWPRPGQGTAEREFLRRHGEFLAGRQQSPVYTNIALAFRDQILPSTEPPAPRRRPGQPRLPGHPIRSSLRHPPRRWPAAAEAPLRGRGGGGGGEGREGGGQPTGGQRLRERPGGPPQGVRPGGEQRPASHPPEREPQRGAGGEWGTGQPAPVGVCFRAAALPPDRRRPAVRADPPPAGGEPLAVVLEAPARRTHRGLPAGRRGAAGPPARLAAPRRHAGADSHPAG